MLTKFYIFCIIFIEAIPKKGSDFMNFAEELRAKREDLGLSIQDSAKKIGVAYNTFKRYETGESIPNEARQEEILIQMENTAEDSEADSLLNDIVTKEIAKMKQVAEENRLLLPLLRKSGFTLVNENGLYYWKNTCGLRTKAVAHEEILKDLEAMKAAIYSTLLYSQYKWRESAEDFDDE